jgi:NAD(P)-dependent dehydrogenase (short-subunit alcohol dehydrogenase family)
MPLSSSTSFRLNSLERPSRVLVIGSSGGIGSAVTDLLASEGFETVHALSRSGSDRSLAGVRVGRIDLENEASIAAAAAQLVEGAPLRFILVATGLLHDRDLSQTLR